MHWMQFFQKEVGPMSLLQMKILPLSLHGPQSYLQGLVSCHTSVILHKYTIIELELCCSLFTSPVVSSEESVWYKPDNSRLNL